MKKRLEESIDRKISKLRSQGNQKVGPQVAKWLKENPGFEQAVAADVHITDLSDCLHINLSCSPCSKTVPLSSAQPEPSHSSTPTRQWAYLLESLAIEARALLVGPKVGLLFA